MLTQRKKFNYMGNSYSKPMGCKAEQQSSVAYRELARKMQELEAVNKKLLDDTTVQFQQFEADITRVEGILEAKEQMNQYLQQENNQLKQEKSILIEALNQKEQVVLEYQQSLTAMQQDQKMYQATVQQLQKQSDDSQRAISEAQCQAAETEPAATQCQPTVTQCRPVQTEDCSVEMSKQNNRAIENLQEEAEQNKQKYEKMKIRSLSLEEQVCRLKEQLFVTCSELTMVKQEFSTAKLLDEIEAARKQ